jgi:hypothetical protein
VRVKNPNAPAVTREAEAHRALAVVQVDAWLRIRPQGGGHVNQRYTLSVMCGRSTYKLTWEEIVRLYRLTLEQRPVNTQSRYNVCPTTTIDTVVGQNGERRLMPMRWGLVPSWWSKPLKQLKLATFNARAETVAEKPFFREAFKPIAA